MRIAHYSGVRAHRLSSGVTLPDRRGTPTAHLTIPTASARARDYLVRRAWHPAVSRFGNRSPGGSPAPTGASKITSSTTAGRRPHTRCTGTASKDNLQPYRKLGRQRQPNVLAWRRRCQGSFLAGRFGDVSQARAAARCEPLDGPPRQLRTDRRAIERPTWPNRAARGHVHPQI